jgi:hypothetical protein
MALINGINSVTKGSSASLTLDKAVLFALPSVVASAHFSDQTNVKLVKIKYKSSPGNQTKVLTFEASQTTPSASILFSLKARDLFQVEEIILVDFDDAFLLVQSVDIPTGLNIEFGP